MRFIMYHDVWQVADQNRFSWLVTCVETEAAEAATAEAANMAAKRREDTCRAGGPARIRVEVSGPWQRRRGGVAVTAAPTSEGEPRTARTRP